MTAFGDAQHAYDGAFVHCQKIEAAVNDQPVVAVAPSHKPPRCCDSSVASSCLASSCLALPRPPPKNSSHLLPLNQTPTQCNTMQYNAIQCNTIRTADEWDPLLKEMLALKITYKEMTGEEFGPPKQEKKKKEKQAPQEAKDPEKAKKKAAEKAAKEEKKRKNRELREAQQKAKLEKESGAGMEAIFGDREMVVSKEITDTRWTKVSDVAEREGGEVTIRGYLEKVRVVGKGAFVVIRAAMFSVQCIAFESKTVPGALVKYIEKTPLESTVDITGTVANVDTPTACTESGVEIQIKTFHTISKADPILPFMMEDASRPDEKREADIGEYTGEEEAASGDGLVRVGQEKRLNYRWLDMRTPANQGIFRVQSMTCHFFRNFLVKKGFTEIHTPKLIEGAAEGGSDVFKLKYFDRDACLAMSPQLHKQIMCACAGFERVFEIGPVFRAENSNTRRHLCEFTGMDLEMAFNEHYDEVLDVLGELFISIFDGLNETCKSEIEAVRAQHPFADLRYLRPTLKLTYAEGAKLLRDAGIPQGDNEDLSTENEKLLGDIVADKYKTDFFFMDKYPAWVRPFYTMPDPNNDKLSNSYDFFIRGQEILSGAQRIHDPELLTKKAAEKGIPIETIQSYVDSFKHGALPHGGGGIGLERVVMLFLNLPNIRKTSAFPRDPKRLSP